MKASLRGLAAANASIARLGEIITPYDFGAQPPVLVAEGQQIYPDRDADRAEIIGKANDLLMLAQVTGGAIGIALKRGIQAQAVLPRTWKGQKERARTRGTSCRNYSAWGWGALDWTAT